MEFIDLPEEINIVSVQPNSQVVISANIPWNEKNPRLFSGKNELLNFLNSVAIYSNSTLTRISNNKVRINSSSISYETLQLQASYIAFKNPQSNSWIFGWITGTEYIGNNVTDISFKLDVFQNFFYTSELKQCFVEYEHVSDDTVGLHTVLEGENPETVIHSETYVDYEGFDILIYATNVVIDGTIGDSSPTIQNGVFTGLSLMVCNQLTAPQVIQALVNDGKENAIALIVMSPKICTTEEIKPISISIPNSLGTNFNQYIPKNKKLFCSPYTFLEVDDHQGHIQTVSFENANLSSQGFLTFNVQGITCTTPTVVTTPTYQNGMDYDEQNVIVTTGFPVCAWVADSFSSWYAQNKAQIGLGVATAVGGIAGGLLSGNPVLATMGGADAMSVVNTIAQGFSQYKKPDNLHGQTLSDSYNVYQGRRSRISFYTKTVKREYAEIIDNRFEKFGYRVNTIKVPNINNRPSWNYVKTRDCIITGITGRYKEELQNMFNEGITLWHTNDVGNFSLNNH